VLCLFFSPGHDDFPARGFVTRPGEASLSPKFSANNVSNPKVSSNRPFKDPGVPPKKICFAFQLRRPGEGKEGTAAARMDSILFWWLQQVVRP